MKPSPLLTTKFTPPPRAGSLPRPHLIDWLDKQTGQRLILISAPPGYGKTTLLADCLAAHSGPSAWYQLEEADSDPTVFLTYLIEAIRRAKLKKAFDSMADVSVGDFRVHFAGDRVASKMVQLCVIDAEGRVRD